MKTFANTAYTTRNYECTNVVACVADQAPSEQYVEADESILEGLTKLWMIAGVAYYGYM